MDILQSISTEHVIVYGFLFITLIIGLFSSRKVSSIKEYALAGKVFGSGVLTITMVATYLEGDVVYTQKNILKYGLVAGLAFIGSLINLVVVGNYIAPRLYKFANSLTLGDVIKELYGEYSGILTGILGTLFSICIIGYEFVILGCICNLFLGWDNNFSIIVMGLIMIIYSSIGGVKSIAITDILHFVVFIFIVPFIANIAVDEAGGILNIARKLPIGRLDIFSSPQFKKYFSNFFVNIIFASAFVEPAVMQRLLMTKYNYQAKNMVFNSATLIFFVRMLITITCLAVLIIEPNITPTFGGAFLNIMNRHFGLFLKFVSILGMVSVLISTIDSMLNASAVLFTHNVLKPLYAKIKINKHIDELSIVRYISFIIGIISIFYPVYNQGEVRLLATFGITILPLLTIPFIMGILGLKSDDKTFLISSLINLFIFIYLSFFVVDYDKDYIQQPILAISSLIIFLSVHFIRHRGFSFIKINPVAEVSYGRLENVSKTNINYATFALTLCIIYAMPFYIPHTHALYPVLILRLVGILLCVGLMLKPYWPTSWNRYFMLYYKFTLFYCLPFLSGILYLANDSNVSWLAGIGWAMMILMPIVKWKDFVKITFSGFGLATLFVNNFLHIPFSSDISKYFMLLLMVVFAVIIGILFISKAEVYNDETKSNLEEYNNINELKLVRELSQPNRLRNILGAEGLGVINELKNIKEEIPLLISTKNDFSLKVAEEKINNVIKYFDDVVEKLNNHISLNISDISLTRLINNGIKKSNLYDEVEISSFVNNSNNVNDIIKCDCPKIENVISNALKIIFNNSNPSALHIFVDKTELSYDIKGITSYNKRIPAVRFAITSLYNTPLLKSFYEGSIEEGYQVLSTSKEVLFRLDNLQIVKAHYGVYIQNNDIIEIILPEDVSLIRPKKLDNVDMENFVSSPPKEYENSDIVESRFLTEVAKASSDIDIDLVKCALFLSKKYHHGQQRKTGEPFYYHTIFVAKILLSYTSDQDAILAALLHDIVEDTKVSLELITGMFNSKVSSIIDTVSKIDNHNRLLTDDESLIKLSQTTNKYSLYIKIADRLHNLRTINGHELSKRRSIAEETLFFFLPLAQNLNLLDTYNEMLNICSRILRY